MISPIPEPLSNSSGRRTAIRIANQIPAAVQYKLTSTAETHTVRAMVLSFNEAGLCIGTNTAIPSEATYLYLSIETPRKTIAVSGHLVWCSEDGRCAVRFTKVDPDWVAFVQSERALGAIDPVPERRSGSRRNGGASSPEGTNRRGSDRRFSELIKESRTVEDPALQKKIKSFLRNKSTNYTRESVEERRSWISSLTGVSLKHIAHFSESMESFRGKIENPIGIAHMPLGIAGPLKINGEHARGTFFVPMATTEGALVTSYTLGSHIITRSGGANVKLLRDELNVGPMFVFRSLPDSLAFVKWIQSNFETIRKSAEATSKHLKLNRLTPVVDGRRVIVNFKYDTGDAMGMNMACKATDVACQRIRAVVKPQEFWLRSNYNANKKATAQNFINGYGKALSADVVIPRKLITLLDTTPEAMAQYFYRTLLADTHSVQIGANGHFANAIAAIFIACGQDAASVANSHTGVSTCEVTPEGDLYFSAYISNLLIGTVGGGTDFGTGRECLQLLGCHGNGKVKRFAEIIAATVLAGEIAICASVANETYVYAHETFGRNRPSK